MSETVAEMNAAPKVFRWLHFGSCLFRIAFNTPAFRNSSFAGLPVQVSQVWRRNVAAVMNDWDAAADLLGILAPSAFSQSWLSSPAIFQQADIILADLALDVFHPNCLQLSRCNDDTGIKYDRIVCNFPDDPPAEIIDRVRAFPCDERTSLAAWEKFGREFTTPVVFVTYEQRDDVSPGYREEFRSRLLHYQNAITLLARQFPHWLVISMDELFEKHGHDCYIDRHHPSPLGWKILSAEIPKIIAASNLISQNPGGTPLPIRDWSIPERCDFGILDDEYFIRLSRLGGSTYAIGPARLTATVKSVFGEQLVTHDSFSQLGEKPSPDSIIILKWSQPVNLPPWLAGLIQRHPETIIEIPTLWKDRESRKNIISKEEQKLRLDLKTFAHVHSGNSITIPDVRPFMQRYLMRCLMRSHQIDHDDFKLVPRQAYTGDSVDLPKELIDTLSTFNPVAVFSAHN